MNIAVYEQVYLAVEGVQKLDDEDKLLLLSNKDGDFIMYGQSLDELENQVEKHYSELKLVGLSMSENLYTEMLLKRRCLIPMFCGYEW